MPTVGRYRSQQRTAPTPDVRRARVPIGQVETPLLRNAPSPDSYGAQLGDTAARLGAAFYGQALAEREKELQQARERQNRIALFEADTKLSAWENQYLHDPQQGILNRRGKDAFGLPDTAAQDFETVYGEIRQTLATDEQRDAFDQLAHTRRKDVASTVMRHTSQQMQAFETENFQSYLRNAQAAALSNFTDPVRVETELERQRTAIYNYGHDNGLGPEWVQEQTDKAVSATHAGVVSRYLSAGQDQFAENYFANWKDAMMPDDILRLEKPLQEGSLRGQSQRAADRILAQAATEAEALEAAQAITEPKLRDEVEDRVARAWIKRKQIEREEREERNRQATEAVQQRMIALANLIDARKSTDAIPPSVWADLTLQQREALESYAKRLDEGRGKIVTDQSRWYALMREASEDPKRFESRDLWLDRSKLSDSDFQELAKLQRAVREGNKKDVDKVLDGIRTPDQIIRSTLRSIGLDPADKANQAAFDQLFLRTARRVDELQRNTGKKATDEDIQKIVDDLVIQEPGQKGSWWSFLPGGSPFFDQPGKRRFELPDSTEPTAVNPKTGERVVFRNGQWVKP